MGKKTTLIGAFVAALLLSGCNCSGATGNCEPQTCAGAGANCGRLDDGCGGKIDCGYCGGGLSCGGDGLPNVCGGALTCAPPSCDDVGAECGTLPDGCGARLNCGYCSAGLTCGGGGAGNLCGVGACNPLTCTGAGADCGTLPDNCGGTLDCGDPATSCASGEVCGGGGAANSCGSGTCTPILCSPSRCGYISDGCSLSIDCDTCADARFVCTQTGDCRDVANTIGNACTTSASCPAGYCLEEAETGWPGGYCTTPCNDDAACGTGNHCAEANICVERCTLNSQCRGGYACFDSDGDGRAECTPSGTGTGSVGDPCDTVADCTGGQNAICIPETGRFPRGMCTQSCGSGQTCPGGTHCSLTGSGRICSPDCTSTLDCRPGYVCGDWDSDGSLECIPAAGTGDPCTANSDCATGTCFTEPGSGYAGGLCSNPCRIDADCATGSRCAPEASGTKLCLTDCNSNRDCRGAGYACVDPDGTGGVCAPYGGGDGDIGDPCDSTADCSGGSGAICAGGALGYPDSECTQTCDSGGGDTCPNGSTCAPAPGGGQEICQPSCTASQDCRPEDACVAGLCVPGGGGGGTGATGSGCTDGNQCVGRICILEKDEGWPGGYCIDICFIDTPNCIGDSHCVDVAGTAGVTMGSCLADCTSAGDCRTGYNCHDMDNDGQSECIPWGSGTAGVGDPCTNIADCQGGGEAVCNLAPSSPDGYCAPYCDTQGCPGGSNCGTSEPPQAPQCFDSICCADYSRCTLTFFDGGGFSDPCPAGQHCEEPRPGVEEGHCVLDGAVCSKTVACPGGSLCESDSGTSCRVCLSGDRCRDDYECYDFDENGIRECYPAAKGTGGPGSPCTRVRDCTGGVRGTCIVEDDGTFLGGYCIWNCSDVACPSGSRCITFRVIDPNGNTIDGPMFCLDSCGSNADCRNGYECKNPTVGGGGGTVCFPE